MIKETKYMTIKNKRTSCILLSWINWFIVLDVFTTIFLLNKGGQEVNPFLNWLTITGLTLNSVVLLTHLIAMIIVIGCIYYIGKKDKIEYCISTMILSVFIIYLVVVLNNLIGVVLLL